MLPSLFAIIISTALMATVALANPSQHIPPNHHHLTFSAAYAADNYHTQHLIQFAKDINALSADTLRSTIHTSGSQHTMLEILDGVSARESDVGEVLISAYGTQHPIFAIDSLPFLTSNFDDARRLYAFSKHHLQEVLHERGLRLLYSIPSIGQGIYSKIPLNSTDDFAHRTFRVYNPVLEELATLLGAQPRIIQIPQLRDALRSQKIDLMITSAATGGKMRAWEVFSHFYDLGISFVKTVVVINEESFQDLAVKQQNVLLEAAATAEKRGWEQTIALQRAATEHLVNQGIMVHSQAKFLPHVKQLSQGILKRWLATAGPQGQALLQAYETQEDVEGEEAE